MAKKAPQFIDSPNFVMEPDNWHMTKSASEEEKQEFEEWMSAKDILFKEDSA